MHAAVSLHLWCSVDGMREGLAPSRAGLVTTDSILNAQWEKLFFLWNNGSLIKELICQRQCIPLRFTGEILLPSECVSDSGGRSIMFPRHVKTRVPQVHKLAFKCFMNEEAPDFCICGRCHSRLPPTPVSWLGELIKHLPGLGKHHSSKSSVRLFVSVQVCTPL